MSTNEAPVSLQDACLNLKVDVYILSVTLKGMLLWCFQQGKHEKASSYQVAEVISMSDILRRNDLWPPSPFKSAKPGENGSRIPLGSLGATLIGGNLGWAVEKEFRARKLPSELATGPWHSLPPWYELSPESVTPGDRVIHSQAQRCLRSAHQLQYVSGTRKC